MEANEMDCNVLLPPRKRLLACMKTHNHNGNGDSNPPSNFTSKNDYSICLNNLLSVHLSDSNLSQMEIVEASRSAAEIATAARAAAEKKVVMAAMAVAAAKKTLELVASVDNKQEISSSTSKKNKRKKHVEVQMLYDNKNPAAENSSKIDKFGEVNTGILGRKKGKMKQKKLPLSICHDWGQLNPNEEHRWRTSESVNKSIGQNSLWKQNKAMQS